MTDPTTTQGILATMTLRKLDAQRRPAAGAIAAPRALTTPRRPGSGTGWVITPGLVHLRRSPQTARVS